MFGLKHVANDNGVSVKVGPAPAQQAPRQQDEALQPGEPASPEEQAAYEEFINNAMETATTDDREIEPGVAGNLQGEFTPEVMQMFEGVEPPLQNTPVEHLALTALVLVMYLDQAAKDQGIEISDEVLFNAGSEVVDIVSSLGEAAGLRDYSEKELEGAWYRALDLYRQVGPRANPDALKEQFAVVHEADKNGKITELLPTLQERMAA